MKIKMITTMAGPDGGASAGQIIDVEHATAEQLVGGGYAVYVDPPKKAPEAAALEPEEQSVIPRAKGRKRGTK